MMLFPDFDAVQSEDEEEEYLDAIAEDGYQRRQVMMDQIRQEIEGLPSNAKDAFWEGWYS